MALRICNMFFRIGNLKTNLNEIYLFYKVKFLFLWLKGNRFGFEQKENNEASEKNEGNSPGIYRVRNHYPDYGSRDLFYRMVSEKR